jgi:glutaminyl-tRNA synthetase
MTVEGKPGRIPSSAKSGEIASAASTSAGNFLRNQIEQDLAANKYAGRHWSGRPGPAAQQKSAGLDPAKIRTRFPPEPNGYLHLGHAKSICLNFGLARDYGGRCHLRFDDTNPVKEDQEYVDSIIEMVQWLGFDWASGGEENLYFASDYFPLIYQCAEALIQSGDAYVDSQSADTMRATRGTLTEAGVNSPFRTRSIEDNLRLFREMRDGKHAEGTHILRAKIDMASPNINLRDPALYRIRFAEHHRTGNTWCIYPMYDYAHPISDALENITHSVCTLEFQDHRPFYDWVLSKLATLGFFELPLTQQWEFARLNITYAITSKRKLQQLVTENHVLGWDDPRMPTLVGLRRRGYTAEALQLFCERIGVSKSDSWIDMSILEAALRDDLDAKAHRAIAVLDPIPLILDNFPDDLEETCSAPVHPHQADLGRREFPMHKTLWIEREDFMEIPTKGYFRLFPGNKVRLRYGFVIEATSCDKNEAGDIIAVHAKYFPDSKSGTPGSDAYKVKGNIHWVSAKAAQSAEVRLYDRLFLEAQPDAGGKDFIEGLNPDSMRVIQAWVEPSVVKASKQQSFQFERHGYFVADRVDHSSDNLVFNRSVGLKDSWGKPG